MNYINGLNSSKYKMKFFNQHKLGDNVQEDSGKGQGPRERR